MGFWFFKSKKLELPPPQKAQFHIPITPPLIELDPKKELEQWPLEWQELMEEIGFKLKQKKIDEIVYIHGTFAGHDPFDLVHLLEEAHPRLSHLLDVKLKNRYLKKLSTQRDFGHFPSDYIHLFQKAIRQNITCRHFVWSGGNHHMARLRGALTLAKNLLIWDPLKQKRIVFVAHSHGGQILALLSHLLENGQLLQFCYDHALLLPSEWQQSSRQKNSSQRLDFVTLGMPPRYSFQMQGDLIHLVNHRGPLPMKAPLSGILRTSGGDYIQQLGLPGSDSLASKAQDRHLNSLLDPLLDKGVDLKLWKEHLKIPHRLHPQGLSLLVDYRDQSPFLPNFLKTLLGHTPYTRYQHMSTNWQLISEYLQG